MISKCDDSSNPGTIAFNLNCKSCFDLFVDYNENSGINLQQKTSSIIYRLICKTHYNIILHKRLDLLMQNILVLHSIDQPTLKNNSRFYSYHLNNQLKSSIAELRVLKNEILLYQQIYINMKSSVFFLIGKSFDYQQQNRNQIV